MTRYQLVLIQPKGFVFVESFREIIECLQFAFEEIGIPCGTSINGFDDAAVPIIFGAHHLQPKSVERLPTNTIIYNTEQLLPGYPWCTEAYLELLGRFHVWDTHQQNIDVLELRGIHNAIHVPVGYMPQMTRIATRAEDVDVLFYGVITDHRSKILEAVAGEGMQVTILKGVFGEERDAWIARSKLVLNLRQMPGGLVETPRISYLLANRKAVVSESDNPEEMDNDFSGGIAVAGLAGIPGLCRMLLDDAASRESLAAQGFAAITAPERRMTALLERALASGAW